VPNERTTFRGFLYLASEPFVSALNEANLTGVEFLEAM
jgi:hypothetical protein